jgi:dTDP-4-amino-4,6-dideoxygalactose transaminase
LGGAVMLMRVPHLDLTAQYASIRNQVEAAVGRVLASQQFILGAQVSGLETEIAAYSQAGHAIACASGSDALLLALLALGIGPGDEVVTSPFTFIATAAAIPRLGARPVFADIEAESHNLDPAAVARSINSRTRAILPVHLYGRLARVEELVEMGRSCHIPVVEDAAQALGARRGGRMAGCFGAIGCYSFYPTKNLGGAGDGGMLVTGDARLAARLRLLRAHGECGRYEYAEVGINSRLDEIQAAVLRVKLRHLEGWNAARREHAAAYSRALAGVVQTPSLAPGQEHAWHQYVVRVPDREGFRRRLAERGIDTAVYYPVPLHLQKCFSYLGYGPGDFPKAEAAAREVVALPLYPELPDEARNYVARVICDWAGERIPGSCVSTTVP